MKPKFKNSTSAITKTTISISIFILLSFSGRISAAPNVLLILTDNQGYHELGCHGHAVVKTPNIDKLAKQSIDFTNFHAPNYCSPSRGVLMTGLYSLRSGIHNTIGGVSILHKDDLTIANMLKKAGYRTGIFGKWHLGMSYPYLPKHRGFDESFIHGGGGIGQLEDYYGNSHINATYWHNGTPVKSNGFSTDILFDQASKFIDNNSKQPFFCFISTPATHKPWASHPEFAKRISEREGEVEDLSLISMIENIDDNVGAILKQIRQKGIENETIVIFTTDQGVGGNRGAPIDDPLNPHTKSFDSGHRVFSIVRYPAIAKKVGRNDALTGMVDIVPTILDLCGVDIPQNLDGRSLQPLLKGNQRWPDDRELIIQCPRQRERSKWTRTSVKTQRWRLVNGKKLYDTEDNGKEVSKKFPEIVKKLTESYERFWHSLPPEDEILSRHILGKEETRLCAVDWYKGSILFNSAAFKSMGNNGIWAIKVVKDGLYRFELRHFPREANKAIKVDSAKVKIGDVIGTTKLAGAAKGAVIELNLKAGLYDMSATFAQNGKEFGAYFVYIEHNPQNSIKDIAGLELLASDNAIQLKTGKTKSK